MLSEDGVAPRLQHFVEVHDSPSGSSSLVPHRASKPMGALGLALHRIERQNQCVNARPPAAHHSQAQPQTKPFLQSMCLVDVWLPSRWHTWGGLGSSPDVGAKSSWGQLSFGPLWIWTWWLSPSFEILHDSWASFFRWEPLFILNCSLVAFFSSFNIPFKSPPASGTFNFQHPGLLGFGDSMVSIPVRQPRHTS
jgi:hypothetical protein